MWQAENVRIGAHQRLILESQRGALLQLQHLASRNTESRVRTTLQNFSKNAKISNVMLKVYHRLFSTTAGRVIALFQKWKVLPVPEDPEKIAIAIKCERILASVATRALKNSFESYKQELFEGEAVKKRAIINLLNKTMSGQKRYFLRWHQYVETGKKILLCKTTIDFFEELNTKAALHVAGCLGEAFATKVR